MNTGINIASCDITMVQSSTFLVSGALCFLRPRVGVLAYPRSANDATDTFGDWRRKENSSGEVK